ncbi:MAG: EAL domain-containing protein, partial [Actinobacteria bacterium]|nr:EAL domain-containing protein [Actinomycetota bacterium]
AVTVGATRVLSPAEWDLHGPASPHGRAALDEVVRARTALLDAVGEAVLALDDRACVVHMNTAAEQLFGWSNEDARGRHLRELGSSDLTSDQVEAVVRHVWAGGTWADDLVIRLRSGRRFEAQVSAAPLLVEGQVSAVITSTVDVSRRLAAVADLSHQVRHDRLTGLRNRAALIESLDEVLTDVASADGATSATVIVVDLEDFRSQNRVLGPALGDHLLRATAAALRQTTHPGDVLARVSGDSFAVCCSHLRDDEAAVRYADHLREAVARPVILGGVRVVLRSSAGVALVRPPTPSSSELLRRADAALLDAKAVGRSSLAYHHQMDERLRRQALLEVLIRRMVAGGRAPLAYQAIHRLADGAVIGAEALLRLRGDSGVPVSPQEVFAAADRAGLSRDVGRLVLEAACQEARRWADARPERQLSVSVNLSPEQFADREIADQVRAALEAAQLDPSRLCLEISESILLVDTEWSARQLALLKMLGVVLVVDDYGTGHTSLVHLKRFPLDSIKIDLSLVAGLPDSPEDLAVVTATMAVADALGLRVVAVGIEDRRQLTGLDRLGCHYGQGFLWSPATSSEELVAQATAAVSVMPDRAPSAGLAAAPAAAPPNWTEELDSILRSLVHEVRTPLTVAMGYASMLEHGADDDRVELAGRIRAATERINRLLANLEDVRLIDNGDLLLEVHRQDVRALVAGIVDDLGGVVHRELVLAQDGDDVVLVDVDDVRIGSAVANLVTNAAKYAQPGSPLGVDVTVDAEWARITVTDDGPGVADADLGLLYRKYGRADRSHRGSGLGLYLARGSARAHGGDISYRRRHPSGSAFTLSIPRCAPSPAQPSDGNGSGIVRS